MNPLPMNGKKNYLPLLCYTPETQYILAEFLILVILSVLLRYTDSDYSFGIFKLFLLLPEYLVNKCFIIPNTEYLVNKCFIIPNTEYLVNKCFIIPNNRTDHNIFNRHKTCPPCVLSAGFGILV
jgi:hypothetical protein